MGLIFSRRHDKPSTRDTLERIEQDIQSIEERRWDRIKREQFFVQILSFLPVTILIANICILIYPSESSWRDKLLWSVPVALLNLLLWVLKKSIQWYSRWVLDDDEARLRKLKKEKKKILEMVCETESYRVATELLEKYDPKQLRRMEGFKDRPTSPLNTTLSKLTASPIRSPQNHNPNLSMSFNVPPTPQHHQQQALSQHSIPAAPTVPSATLTPAQTPLRKLPTRMQTVPSSTNVHNSSINNTSIATSSVQGRPVRPILSKDRSLIEKMVDWVVSDGPDNRFALVCRFCYGHNGMSLAEEFETINFRCCYCYNLNTAANKNTQVHDQLQPDRESESTKAPSTKGKDQSDDNGNDILEPQSKETVGERQGVKKRKDKAVKKIADKPNKDDEEKGAKEIEELETLAEITEETSQDSKANIE